MVHILRSLILLLSLLLVASACGPAGGDDDHNGGDGDNDNNPNHSGPDPCTPETRKELCGDRQCGTYSTVDRCGTPRQVECGVCDDHEECIDHQCLCTPETDPELCASNAAVCGPITVIDACLEVRELFCGDCPEEGECIDNICRCDDEPVQPLCESVGAACGTVEITDSCGILREVGCGLCEGSEECIDHQCVCFAETDPELCEDRPAGECGTITVEDRCGDDRTLLCEPCAAGDATLGAVRDALTGELIEDALIRVYQWPPPVGASEDWVWPSGYRADDPDFAASTRGPDDNGPASDVNYELTDGDPICVEDAPTATLVAHQWYRVRVDRPGYEPRIFYRYHQGFSFDQCPSACPASSEAGCHRWDFDLWPDDALRPLMPDLVVDARNLNDQQWQCAHLPPGSTHERVIGLRFAAGAVNVGTGPFRLEGQSETSGTSGIVHQVIQWSDGSTEINEFESERFIYDSPVQPRLMVWLRLGLVDPVDECRDVDDRPASCLSHTHEKWSFCLHDSDEFDRDAKTLFGGLTSIFTNPPTCITGTIQGITSGWKDTYQKHLPDQSVIMGPPSEASTLGSRWLEVELDPRRVLELPDRLGTVARVLVDIPSNTAAFCDDPDTILDCTGHPDNYTLPQRWGCPRYLDYGE